MSEEDKMIFQKYGIKGYSKSETEKDNANHGA
jgi:hypothetical protein